MAFGDTHAFSDNVLLPGIRHAQTLGVDTSVEELTLLQLRDEDTQENRCRTALLLAICLRRLASQ